MSEANEYRPWEHEGITELEYFKRAYVESLKEVARLREALKWKPWDTRPRDGREVLGRWSDRVESAWCLPDGSWHWFDGDTSREPPTHWRALEADDE